MTLKENVKVLETYLHHIRNIEEVPPGPVEQEALDAIIGFVKSATEHEEYGAFVWDKQRRIFVPIGRETLGKQLCLNRYQERMKSGHIPKWIDPEKFRILKRTVAEAVGDWNQI